MARVRARAAFLASDAGSAMLPMPLVCECVACRALDAAHPAEGRQLRLADFSSGEQPDALPLPDPDAPAFPEAGVSAPKAAQSRQALAAVKPETASP